jgi:hypothetical protein
LLPHNDSAQSPFVWLASFDEGAAVARASELPDAGCADREEVDCRLPWSELGSWREMATAPVETEIADLFAEAAE